MQKTHSFHIPVMGIGFTIDSPLKVSQYGMDSVISLVDDILLEKLRKMYSKKFEVAYKEITNKVDDFRAKRITSYLDLIQKQAEKNFEALKDVTNEKCDGIRKYINMLPDYSSIKKDFESLVSKGVSFLELRDWAHRNLKMGSIDVNIMTKIDKTNFHKKEQLPVEYNDAHAALRGYAMSNLSSSLILSAGMNPRLYTYMSQFNDFFPLENGSIKKKIILKVSDYRSALIQGKFLAKKGLWVSEYRIESGLNCGGHAFATDGFLLGPVLEEFKKNRETLRKETLDLLNQALLDQNRVVQKDALPILITAQGGVGTEAEQRFLLEHYKIDSVGWGSPFLLVPEATTVDKKTLNKLVEAREEDLYLSDVSPLGVPFHNLRGNTKDIEKQLLIEKSRPGSSCPSKFISLNTDFKASGICTASREYQYLKIKELDAEALPLAEHEVKLNKIVEKSCICVGLGTSALLEYDLDRKSEGEGVSVCPGPNIAYYSKVLSLKNITDHIYGRENVISRNDRPNMFIKELNIYIEYLQNKLEESKAFMDVKKRRYLLKFRKNLLEGIEYYTDLFLLQQYKFIKDKERILLELRVGENRLSSIAVEIENIK